MVGILRRLAWFLLLLAPLVAPGGPDGALLRVGVFGQDPPRSFLDHNGSLAGLDIDVARALCQAIGAECELVPVDWDSLIAGLVEGRFHFVVASISITDARRERIGFTRPYYNTPGRFIARRGRFQAINPETATGLRIGVRRGTTFDKYVTDNLSAGKEIIRYSTQPDALVDLRLGRLDLVLGDHMVLDRTFLSTRSGADFELVGGPVADARWFGYGNGIALPKGAVDLRDQLDRAVADIHANGVFDAIQTKWIGYDVRDLTGDLQRKAEAAAIGAGNP